MFGPSKLSPAAIESSYSSVPSRRWRLGSSRCWEWGDAGNFTLPSMRHSYPTGAVPSSWMTACLCRNLGPSTQHRASVLVLHSGERYRGRWRASRGPISELHSVCSGGFGWAGGVRDRVIVCGQAGSEGGVRVCVCLGDTQYTQGSPSGLDSKTKLTYRSRPKPDADGPSCKCSGDTGNSRECAMDPDDWGIGHFSVHHRRRVGAVADIILCEVEAETGLAE